MKHIALIIFLSLIFKLGLQAQYFAGIVTNELGEPISGTTIYIEEARQGLICNDAGEFQTKMPEGIYHVEFSCLGYHSQKREVNIKPEANNYLSIVLQYKDIGLSEIQIYNSKEDPAIAIMRKAIANAPMYRSMVKKYTAEAYVKGSGKLLSIPKVLQKIGGAGDEIALYKKKLFLQESFNEISFEAPDKIVQNVRAFSSSFPDNLDPKDVMSVINNSVYSEMYESKVSPLHSKALSYYRFQYEGFEEEGDDIINKIKIIPRLADRKLLKGYIYVADNSWDVRHAAFEMWDYGQQTKYEITYKQLAPSVYLPTAYSISVDVSMMGVKAYFNYLSSVKYLSMEVDENFIVAQNAQKYKEKPKGKKSKAKKGFEVKADESYKVETDSLATVRDSLFWDDVRNVRLNAEELSSYIRKDTLQSLSDSFKQKRLHPTFSWSDLIFGGSFGGDSSLVRFGYNGLARALPEYNFADGYWLGQSFDIRIKRNAHSSINIEPQLYWTSAREEIAWKVSTSFEYSPMRAGVLSLSGGSLSEDYHRENGMLRIENTLYTLFAGVNKAKFYKRDYIALANDIEISNGLQLKLGMELSKRTPLLNGATYSFFGKGENIEPNLPDYDFSLNSHIEGLSKYSIALSYTPAHYYTVAKNRKIYLPSRFPTFNIEFEQGFSAFVDSPSKFVRMEGGVSQSFRLGIFDRLSYSFNAGKFINSNTFNYIDYKHFNTGNQLLGGKYFDQTYALLPAYRFSTSDYWLQGAINYHTEYLALKRLPLFQGKLFREALHAKWLHTDQKSIYSEWGYSLALPIGAIGVFVSFEAFDPQFVGFRISFPLLKEINLRK